MLQRYSAERVAQLQREPTVIGSIQVSGVCLHSIGLGLGLGLGQG